MSLFTLGTVETKTEHGAHPEGKFIGKIISPTIKKSAAGHEYLSFTIKTEAGQLFHSLHIVHPKAKESAHAELSKIFTYGYNTPPKTIETMAECAMALDLVPVHVTIKHGGENEKGYMNYKVYFNALPAGTAKAEYGASALPF